MLGNLKAWLEAWYARHQFAFRIVSLLQLSRFQSGVEDFLLGVVASREHYTPIYIDYLLNRLGDLFLSFESVQEWSPCIQ